MQFHMGENQLEVKRKIIAEKLLGLLCLWNQFNQVKGRTVWPSPWSCWRCRCRAKIFVEIFAGDLLWITMVIIAGKHPLERARRTQWFHRIQLENTIFGNFKKPKIHFAFPIWMKVTAGEKWKKCNLSLHKFFLLFSDTVREKEKVRPRGSKSKGRACLVSWLQKI